VGEANDHSILQSEDIQQLGREIKYVFKRKRATETNHLIDLYNEVDEDKDESDATEEFD